MKKFLLLMTILGMVLGLLACGNRRETTSKQEVLHSHNYADATCTRPKRCDCGRTKGTALGHELMDGVCMTCGEVSEYNVGNFIVLGDSYSSFRGYVPLGNECQYPSENCSVTNVEQMWWSIFEKNTKGRLLLNESYSGSTISYTSYNGVKKSEISYIKRFEQLVKEGFFESNQVNTIIVFGGTNDDWAGVPIGTEKYSDWNESDKLAFLPAFCYLLNSIQTNVPDAKIVCIINECISYEFKSGMANVCKAYGINYVQLTNIDLINYHPSNYGMERIEKQLRILFEQQ